MISTLFLALIPLAIGLLVVFGTRFVTPKPEIELSSEPAQAVIRGGYLNAPPVAPQASNDTFGKSEAANLKRELSGQIAALADAVTGLKAELQQSTTDAEQHGERLDAHLEQLNSKMSGYENALREITNQIERTSPRQFAAPQAAPTSQAEGWFEQLFREQKERLSQSNPPGGYQPLSLKSALEFYGITVSDPDQFENLVVVPRDMLPRATVAINQDELEERLAEAAVEEAQSSDERS